ncbi:MAG: pyruvate dehydrogenase [Lachnospiraceae bacterium]|nr:pyruvate dehydrogenase [Lachnospiraceae bacterium]
MSTPYEKIIKIRAFEELLLTLFGQNKLSGTTHTYIGEEATAVALMKYVKDDDKVFSNHRCHGHFLAYGGPEKLLLAEIMSKKSGLCQGRGGSQHIHYKNFFSNGVQGGIVPNALGVAFADKLNGKDANTVVFLGDGTLGQGVVYESLNIASIYDVPVVFVIEDNQYAMSTKRKDAFAGDIKQRIEGFNIKTFEIESTNVDELDLFFENVFSYINTERKPVCAIVHNYRLAAHSKGDDLRDPNEIEQYAAKDPILYVKEKIGEDRYDECYALIKKNLEMVVENLESETSIDVLDKCDFSIPDDEIDFISHQESRYVDLIREALDSRLQVSNDTYFLGEDIKDPYGGPFKATKGLSTKYERNVLNMPISEACMVGMGVGMALNQTHPVIEIMFGDFLSLGFDQILNHASKYAWVYGDSISVPLIVRAPMGAKRGYGPTHSQSLEKFFVGIPGIRVLALTPAVNPMVIYDTLFNRIEEPTIMIENKGLYAQKSWLIENGRYKDFFVTQYKNDGYPTVLFSFDPSTKPDCYLVAYGGMSNDALNAAEKMMMEEEIQVDVIIPTQLSPFPCRDLERIIKGETPIAIVEEGTRTAGIGAEFVAFLSENRIGSKYLRIAMPDIPIPNGLVLENQVIPDARIIKDKILAFIK